MKKTIDKQHFLHIFLLEPDIHFVYISNKLAPNFREGWMSVFDFTPLFYSLLSFIDNLIFKTQHNHFHTKCFNT